VTTGSHWTVLLPGFLFGGVGIGMVNAPLATTAVSTVRVERAGGRDWAQLQAADRMSRAMHELSRAIPDPEAAGGLLALAEFVTRRSN